MGAKNAAQRTLTLVLTILLAGFLGATLMWMAPGHGVDERELDPRLDEASLEALRTEREAERNPVRFFISYLSGALEGDLGESRSLGQPVLELIRDRFPETARSVSIGLVLGWISGLALAFSTQFVRIPGYGLVSTLASGVFLCLPSAVLALVFLFLGAPVSVAIASVVFPRVFRYSRNLFVQANELPHILTATAKGLSRTRILIWHLLPAIGPQLLALLGVSVNLAFTAAIPIEVLCDSPGVGQLAWMAALGRDLPLLVNLTLVVAAITLVANAVSDWAGAAGSLEEARP